MIYEPMIGDHLSDVCRLIVEIANEHQTTVTAEFNTVTLTATPGADPADVAAAFTDELDRRAAARRATQEWQAEQERLAEWQRIADEAAQQPLATFALKDADGWQRTVAANTDPYGAAGIRYAARWAALMEQELADGKAVADVAEATSSAADLEGITGFQYGCARSILCQVWTHGNELAEWRKTQVI